jgi:cytochrome c-type protein NapC
LRERWRPRWRSASVAHQRFLFTNEKTCIDCHKGIAHRLPDMRGIPGWQ